jgi:DUF1680 family protein
MDRFGSRGNSGSTQSATVLKRRHMLKISSLGMAAFFLSGPAVQAFSWRDGALYPEISPKENVRLLKPGAVDLEGELAKRFRLNIDYLLWRYRDADRLLFPFEHRDQWQRIHDWDGEYAGKWLDAAVHTLSAMPHPELETATQQFAARLLATQETDGYLGTELPENRLKTTWPLWMHWLAMKSLRAYGEYSGKQAYKMAAIKGADWILEQFDPILDERSPFLRESGYLSNVDELTAAYLATGDRKYYEFARRAILTYPRLKKMRESEKADGGHSYSMATYLGAAVLLAQAGADEEMLDWIIAIWQDIADHHTFPTGSNSTHEHLKEPPANVQDGELQETCATVEWLIFTHRLYLATGEVRFMNMLERTVRNALLGAQSTDGMKWTYFLPMGQYKKWLNGPTNCCFYSGPRGIARLPRLIYHLDEQGLRIDLFESGKARFDWEGIPVLVSQETTYPLDGKVVIRVAPERPLSFSLKIRIPEHCDPIQLMVDGEPQAWQAQAGQYIVLSRTWRPEQTIALAFDLQTKVERLSDGTGVVLRGPQALAVDRRDNRVDMRYIEIVEPIKLQRVDDAADGRPQYQGIFEVAGKNTPVVLTPFSEAGNASVGVKHVHARYRAAFPVSSKN